jgi:hypothetical protein
VFSIILLKLVTALYVCALYRSFITWYHLITSFTACAKAVVTGFAENRIVIAINVGIPHQFAAMVTGITVARYTVLADDFVMDD